MSYLIYLFTENILEKIRLRRFAQITGLLFCRIRAGQQENIHVKGLKIASRIFGLVHQYLYNPSGELGMSETYGHVTNYGREIMRIDIEPAGVATCWAISWDSCLVMPGWFTIARFLKPPR